MGHRLGGVLIVLVAASLAACGSSGGSAGSSGTTSAADYVHQVCTAIGTAGKQIQAAGQQFQTTIRGDEKRGLDAIKRDSVAYFDNVTAKVEAMKSSIAKAGTPDVSGGAAVHTGFLKGMDQIVATMHRVQSDVRNISTGNPQRFMTKIQGAASQVQSAFSRMGRAVGALRNPQLDEAARNDRACQALASGTP